MVYSLVLAITPKNQQTINRSYQRKLGSNTSELRMAFTWWNWPWWRVVHHITIHNKGIRSYDTGWWRREVVTKGSGDEVKWWWRDDDGKWWRWEVVRKASGDEGKWWGREVVMKGSGDDGKWWRRECGERREVVRKGGGDEGKWWRWEVVTKRVWWTKGSGEDGKLWRREVVTMGSGDEGKWWWRECCKMHCNGCMNVACSVLLGGSRSTKSCVFRVKWLQLAMKGTSCVQRVRLGSLGSFYMCFATNGCSCVRSSMRFLKVWLQIALEWLHECCMLCVVGRKLEHEILRFPCKVAAAGDERYLVCAAGAAGVAWFLLYVFCNEWLFLCA